jgi:hypothetical protein
MIGIAGLGMVLGQLAGAVRTTLSTTAGLM